MVLTPVRGVSGIKKNDNVPAPYIKLGPDWGAEVEDIFSTAQDGGGGEEKNACFALKIAF